MRSLFVLYSSHNARSHVHVSCATKRNLLLCVSIDALPFELFEPKRSMHDIHSHEFTHACVAPRQMHTQKLKSRYTADAVTRHSPAAASSIAPAVHDLGFELPVRQREASEPRGQCAQAHAAARTSPSAEAGRPAVPLCAALAAAAARDPSALCSRGRSHSSHMPQVMGSHAPRGSAHLNKGISTRPPLTMPTSLRPPSRPHRRSSRYRPSPRGGTDREEVQTARR